MKTDPDLENLVEKYIRDETSEKQKLIIGDLVKKFDSIDLSDYNKAGPFHLISNKIECECGNKKLVTSRNTRTVTVFTRDRGPVDGYSHSLKCRDYQQSYYPS